MLKHLPLVQLPSTTPPTYPLGVAYSDPWDYILFSVSFGLENGSGGGESDYQRQRLQAFTFGGTPVDHRLRRTGFYFDWLRRFVSDSSRHHQESSSEYIRWQWMPYTRNNDGKNGHGLGTITNNLNHIPLAALQFLLISIKRAYLTFFSTLSLGVLETNAG